MTLLTEEPDPGIPLVVPVSGALSEKAQNNLLAFAEKGGSLILTPVIPDRDQDFGACSLLGPLFGGTVFKRSERTLRALYAEGVGSVYGMGAVTEAEELPADAEILARDADGDAVFAFLLPFGKGKAVFLGADFMMTSFTQPAFLESLLSRLGAAETVRSENRNIFTSLLEDGEGRRMLFLMNLYSGRQKTSVRVVRGGEVEIDDIELQPMEVKTYEL